MKNRIILFTLLLMIFSSINAQEKRDSLKLKTNPIIFGDLNIGYINGNLQGLTGGVTINYQKGKNLFTFRWLENIDYEKVDWVFGFIPVNIDFKIINEYAVLFGKRYIENDLSYHFSGGISYNTYKYLKSDIVIDQEDFIGFPIEFGMRFFKAKKNRFRILYGIIPVGKPTGFARSFGFKLYANIAKRSHVGIGLSFGLGYHKKYN